MTETPERDMHKELSKDSPPALASYEKSSELSHSLLQALDASKDTVLLTDANTIILYVNRSFMDISGFDAEDLIGQQMTTLWLQPDATTRNILTELSKKNTWHGQIKHKTMSGDHFRESATISPVMDENGRIIHFIKTGQIMEDEKAFTGICEKEDLTDKNKAYRQLEESNESYHRVMELAPDAITISRLADGRYIEVNKAFCDLTGYSFEQIIGRTALELNIYANKEDRKKIVQVLRNQGHISGLRLEFRHKDGSPLHGIISCRIIQFKGEECLLFLCTLINSLVEAQKALRESEKRNRVILGAAPDAICLTRVKDGRFIQANDMFYERSGYTPEEVIGRTVFDLDIYADEKERKQFISALRANGKMDGMEILTRYKDGTLSHQLWAGRIIEWEGEPCVLVVTKEIDELKKAQQMIYEREQSYYTILNAAPYGIVIVRRSDSKMVLVNDAYCRRTGFTREEAIGRTSKELRIYADPSQRDRIIQRLGRDGKVSGVEVKFRTKFGKVYESLVSVTSFIHMGEECLLTITMDISEQKEAQRQFKKSELRFRTIFESARDGIFLKDATLKYTLVNPSMERLYKIDPSKILGHTDEELFDDQGMGKTQITEKKVLQGEIVEEEIKIQGKTTQIFHTIKIPLMGKSGDIKGICGFVRDITSVKQLESQLLQAQKMEAVGTLAGGISHDFNNLLQAIIGYSQILLMDKNESSLDYSKIKMIETAAQRACDLTAQLLTFSRKMEIHPRPINLNHIVKQVEKLLKRTIPKMIDIELNLAKPLLTVNVDPGQVEQVLLNIGINARDAMPDGGQLKFKTLNVARADAFHRRYLIGNIPEYVMLSVEDSGQGMTEDTLERIFEPFYTTKAAGKGTGLGLATAYGIIQNHGGQIFCESRTGEGTCFYIYFPAINFEIPKEAEKRRVPVKKGSGETVLFVDDEEVLRSLAEEFLADTGYHAITAEDGESGLSLYKENMSSISVVILDLMMPGMGGKSCLNQILEINPKARVIICSGHTPDDPDTDEILKKASYFLKKPYDFKKLLQLIEKEIGKK